MSARILLAAALAASLAACAAPSTVPEIAPGEGGSPATIRVDDGERVLFVGDSITHRGTYVVYFETFARSRSPGRDIDVVAIGLGSETVSGLSEKIHPFPRPDLHERLDRALAKVEPDLVVACYGMNDGIYHPLGEERFEAFRAGVTALVERVRATGAELVLVTPPPFDVESRRKRAPVARAGLPDYSYRAPYEGYDEVLGAYARWIMELSRPGLTSVDVHATLSGHMRRQRAVDPDFVLSGDGIHPDREGHFLMAQALIEALLESADPGDARVDAESGEALAGAIEAIDRAGDELRFTWGLGVPLARDPKWSDAFVESIDFVSRVNPARLHVARLAPGAYELVETVTAEGETSETSLGRFDAGELDRGIEIFRTPISRNELALRVLPLVEARRRLLDNSWRSDVGHKHPSVRKERPLEDVLPRAETMERAIRDALDAPPVRLVLRPVSAPR